MLFYNPQDDPRAGVYMAGMRSYTAKMARPIYMERIILKVTMGYIRREQNEGELLNIFVLANIRL